MCTRNSTKRKARKRQMKPDQLPVQPLDIIFVICNGQLHRLAEDTGGHLILVNAVKQMQQHLTLSMDAAAEHVYESLTEDTVKSNMFLVHGGKLKRTTKTAAKRIIQKLLAAKGNEEDALPSLPKEEGRKIAILKHVKAKLFLCPEEEQVVSSMEPTAVVKPIEYPLSETTNHTPRPIPLGCCPKKYGLYVDPSAHNALFHLGTEELQDIVFAFSDEFSPIQVR